MSQSFANPGQFSRPAKVKSPSGVPGTDKPSNAAQVAGLALVADAGHRDRRYCDGSLGRLSGRQIGRILMLWLGTDS